MRENELFKKLFPHLAKEMEDGKSRVRMDDLEEPERQEPQRKSRKWAGHYPDVVDFIRRCVTPEQAEEIISYMESRGEITRERAIELRRQLLEEGLESFGNRKEEGFYHKDR